MNRAYAFLIVIGYLIAIAAIGLWKVSGQLLSGIIERVLLVEALAWYVVMARRMLFQEKRSRGA